jgi:putative sigma-54 modulation protein
MNIHYTARQSHLTPEVKTYCERRLTELKRLMGFATEVDVILSHEKNRERAEIHVKAKGAGLVVVEESSDVLSALHMAFDALEKKIKKEREKYREKKRRGGRERKSFALPAAETGEPEKRVIRADYFSAKPMTLEEAALELDLKKKEVYVFRMESTEKWAVIYRRKDGHYGLVEPE